jgi:hypothetical protein
MTAVAAVLPNTIMPGGLFALLGPVEESWWWGCAMDVLVVVVVPANALLLVLGVPTDPSFICRRWRNRRWDADEKKGLGWTIVVQYCARAVWCGVGTGACLFGSKVRVVPQAARM